jgi:hypothetical protein
MILASTDLAYWDLSPQEYPRTTYRLWDSDVGYVEIAVFGWLTTAISRSGMKSPRKAEFLSQGVWVPVSQFALTRAIKESQKEVSAS